MQNGRCRTSWRDDTGSTVACSIGSLCLRQLQNARRIKRIKLAAMAPGCNSGRRSARRAACTWPRRHDRTAHLRLTTASQPSIAGIRRIPRCAGIACEQPAADGGAAAAHHQRREQAARCDSAPLDCWQTPLRKRTAMPMAAGHCRGHLPQCSQQLPAAGASLHFPHAGSSLHAIPTTDSSRLRHSSAGDPR